jgi:hypothetical protein
MFVKMTSADTDQAPGIKAERYSNWMLVSAVLLYARLAGPMHHQIVLLSNASYLCCVTAWCSGKQTTGPQ